MQHLTAKENKQFKITLKTIGHNINNARRQRDFTLKKLSRCTGLNMETLDNYELGKTNIQVHILMKISIALGVSLHNLMENT